jgi:lysophospholipase L1-like esterase
MYTIAANGRTAASGAAEIDAELAASSANPGYILFNLGVTDVDALPAEATWKANIGYILDAMHAKWPSAKIYMMRVWRRDYGSECNTLDGWIDAIIAARDYCYTGPDERVFLENGDDGATYTTDGIHPNAAGYALTAAQWQTVMGY